MGAADTPAALEVLTTGRISVDLYSEEPGLGWDDVTHFVKSIGGTATNVAIAASRLGHSSAVYTKIGADPFGPYVRRQLASFGVSDRYVITHPTRATPLAFAVLDPPEDPQLHFRGRETLAPDLDLAPGEVDAATLESVPVFWVTGTSMSAEPAASTTLAMLRTRGRRAHTVVDLDYRPMFWPSAEAARAGISQLIAHCTVAVGNRTECDVAVGTSDPNTAADRLLEHGVDFAVVKMGGDGVLAATREHRVVLPPTPINMVCGLGAGDAFGGALIHGLLAGWEPERTVTYANAAGAIVAARLLCSDAMPTVAEIDYFLETSHVPHQAH